MTNLTPRLLALVPMLLLAACPSFNEDCSDGVDNNGDALADCDDPLCAASPECLTEDCTDGEDNDGDGDVDCADTECEGHPSCTGDDDDDSAGDDDDATGDDDDSTGPSSILETLEPCTQVFDSYIVEGPTTITVDTVAADTAFDTVLFVATTPGDYETPAYDLAADDAFDCSFEPPNGYQCSQLDLEAGTWEVMVTAAIPYGPCADDAVGAYEFTSSATGATIEVDDGCYPGGWFAPAGVPGDSDPAGVDCDPLGDDDDDDSAGDDDDDDDSAGDDDDDDDSAGDDDDDDSVGDDDDDDATGDDDDSSSGCAEGTVDCSGPVEGTTVDRVSTIDDWTHCDVGWPSTGGEAIFEFTPDFTGEVTFSLLGDNPTAQDLDLYVVTSCDDLATTTCLGVGVDIGGDETVVIEAVAGESMYLVVEGYGDAADTFTLSASCPDTGDDDDDDSAIGDDDDDDATGDDDDATGDDDDSAGDDDDATGDDDDSAIGDDDDDDDATGDDDDATGDDDDDSSSGCAEGTVDCSGPAEGTTIDRVSAIDDWTHCEVTWPSTGGEAIFEFTPDFTGEVTFSLLGDNPTAQDLDLYVVTSCDDLATTTCLGVGVDIGGDETVVIEAAAGETMYLVVEGFGGAADTFTLSASCPDTGDDDDDDSAIGDDDDDATGDDDDSAIGDDDDDATGDDDDATGDDDDSSATFEFTGALEACTETFDSFIVEGPAVVNVDTIAAETTFDTVLLLASAVGDYTTPAYDLAWDDSFDCAFAPPSGYQCSSIPVPAGTYEVIVAAAYPLVDACADSASGEYFLTVDTGAVTLGVDDECYPGGWFPWATEDPAADCDDPALELDCTDGLDNDSDGLIDCLDEDCCIEAACATSEACYTPEECGDGVDNDGDLDVDCDDADCAASPLCLDEPVDCIQDEAELLLGDDSLDIAFVAELNTVYPRTLETDDDDWYLLSVPVGCTITAEANFAHDGGDIDLAFYDAEGTFVDASESETDNESLAWTNTGDGAADVAMQVTLFGDEFACNEYAVLTLLSCPLADCEDTEFEDDDTPLTANVATDGEIFASTSAAGDFDWFTIDVEDGCTVTASTGTTAVAHQLWTSSFELLDESTEPINYIHAGETISLYSVVFGLTETSCESYDFGYEVVCDDDPIACEDDTLEPNDTALDAGALAPGAYALTTASTEDWFETTVEPGTIQTISIDFLNAEGDLDLAALDTASEVVALSNSTDDSETIALANFGTEAAVYSVRVFLFGGDAAPEYCQEYTLTSSVVTDDLYEDNDVLADATTGFTSDTNLLVTDVDDDWYAVDICAGGSLTVTAPFDGGDLDLELYDAAESELLAFSWYDNPELLTFTNAGADGTFYLLVLQYDAASAAIYDLDILVDGCDPVGDDDDDATGDDDDDATGDDDDATALDCGEATIDCGESVIGSTVGRTSLIDSWSQCDITWPSTGPEAVYEFTPTASGSVTFELLGDNPTAQDLDLYIATTCDFATTTCAGVSADFEGEELVTVDAVAGETLYVVVEGYNLAADSFTLNVSCETTGDDLDIVETAVSDGRFTTLVSALVDTGLDAALSGDGPFTVFAPTDEAFAALPAGTLDALTTEELADILLYHVVSGAVDAATVSGLATATTLLGAPVAVDATAGVVINDAAVTTADVVATNGIIHVVDTVLLPPGTIAEVATDAGVFTSLLDALTETGLAGTFADPLAGPFTVFAPTDDAFAAISDTVAGLSTEQLATVLQYHVVEGIVDSNAVVGLTEAPTLLGESIDVDASSGVVLDGSSNVIGTDVVARNGIVHIIDAVLIPDALTAEPPAETLVISEIMKNPSVASDNGEWFEVFNPGSSDVSMLNWTLADLDTDIHTVSDAVIVPAGGYAVFGNNPDTVTNGGVVLDYSYGSGWSMANGSDEVLLISSSAVIVDEVDYTDADFPDSSAVSLTLGAGFDWLADDNNDGTFWCNATSSYGDGDLGTPGLPNDPCP